MNLLKYFSFKKTIIGLFAAVGLVFAANVALQNVAVAQDCSTNSIIQCGVVSREDLRTKYNASPELKALYGNPMTHSAKDYGLQGNDIDRVVSKGKDGMLCKNGDLIVDGRVVVENSWTVGRESHNSPYRYPFTVNSTAGPHTYYYGTTQVSFGEKTICTPVYVLFNDEGEIEFSVMTACGNLTWGDNQKPVYECKELKKTPVLNKKNTYSFTTETFEDKGANITKITYDFGDGTKQERTNKNEKFAVEHTYATSGKFTVKTTVTVSLPGDITKTISYEHCQTIVEIPEEKKPIYRCDSLTGKLIQGNRNYRFTLKATAKDGAELTEVDVDYNDGQKVENAKPQVKTGDIVMTFDHQYAAALTGKKTITADLTFTIGTDKKNVKCSTPIELTELTCDDKPNAPECKKECKPGIPENDARCTECKPGVPSNSPLCTPPSELPKTGPMEIVGSALGLGSIAGAGLYYHRTRRSLIDTILNR